MVVEAYTTRWGSTNSSRIIFFSLNSRRVLYTVARETSGEASSTLAQIWSAER